MPARKSHPTAFGKRGHRRGAPATAAARRTRRQPLPVPHRSPKGRGRLPSRKRRPSFHRPPGLKALHALRRHQAPRILRAVPGRKKGRGGRTQQHRGQAHGHVARRPVALRQRHGHRVPLTHPGPRRRHP